MAPLQTIGKTIAMKNLLTAALVFTAISLSAVENPPPPTYCDCVGIGHPKKEAPLIHTTTIASKSSHLSFAARMFYEIELWAIIAGPGIYK
jgi:hypothetical protein